MNGLKRVARRHRDALAQMGWDRLETLLAAYYRSEGYEVEHTGTGATGARFDGGIDLKLRRGEQFIVVQCKHWTAMKVPHNAVHELLGLMVNHGATGAVLASSGEFTRAAVEAAQRLGHVRLIDGDELRAMLGPIREPAPAFEVRMGAARGAEAIVAARVGERLLSAADRGRHGERSRAATRAPRWALGLLLVALVVMAGWFAMRTVQTLPTPHAAAPVAAPVESSPVPARTPEQASGQAQRADEAMRVIRETTPEL